jgi:hypothetical protein
MALEGTIKDFGLPDIFQLIGLQRKTGVLTLKHDKEQLTITFENGMVVYADAANKRVEDRIGNLLVKQGKLSKERLEEALQKQKQTLQKLGHVLISQGYIAAKDLKDALQVQIAGLVFKVFRWREGEYHFAPSDTVEYEKDHFNPMSADFILMEGIRMVDEWPIIEKKIPSMDMVLKTVVDPRLIEVGGGSEEAGEDLFGGLGEEPKRSAASSSSKIRLTPDEERVFRKVDGTRTVQEIIDGAGLGEFEVCRTLFDLMNRNLVAPGGRGAAIRATDATGLPVRPMSGTPGYVAIALALALSAGAVFVHLTRPFAVLGLSPLLSGTYTLLLEGVRNTRLQRLDRAIVAYNLAHGRAPATLEELVKGGLVDRSYLTDPWARPYHYAHTENGYLLSAVDDRGKDIPGTIVERELPTGSP